MLSLVYCQCKDFLSEILKICEQQFLPRYTDFGAFKALLRKERPHEQRRVQRRRRVAFEDSLHGKPVSPDFKGDLLYGLRGVLGSLDALLVFSRNGDLVS